MKDKKIMDKNKRRAVKHLYHLNNNQRSQPTSEELDFKQNNKGDFVCFCLKYLSLSLNRRNTCFYFHRN